MHMYNASYYIAVVLQMSFHVVFKCLGELCSIEERKIGSRIQRSV